MLLSLRRDLSACVDRVFAPCILVGLARMQRGERVLRDFRKNVRRSATLEFHESEMDTGEIAGIGAGLETWVARSREGKGRRLYANERRARRERATQRVSPSIRELSSRRTLDTAHRLVPQHELDAQSQLSVHAESAHAAPLRLARRSFVRVLRRAHRRSSLSCLSAAHSHTAAAQSESPGAHSLQRVPRNHGLPAAARSAAGLRPRPAAFEPVWQPTRARRDPAAVATGGELPVRIDRV
jgi:hypothetical protein